MNIILEHICKNKEFSACIESLKNGNFPALINGVCDSAIPAFASALSKELSKKAVFIAPDEKSVNKLKAQLEAYMDRVLVFPSRSIMYDTVETASREWEHSRVSVLDKLLDGDWDAVVCVPDAIMQFTLPPKTIKECSFSLSVGKSYDIKLICDKLLIMGYCRAEFVEGKGQFSVRGGILDVFPSGEEKAVRIDFFGDEADKIGHFDVLTQRCVDSIENVKILPCTENVYDYSTALRVLEFVNEKLHSAKGLDGQAITTLCRERDAIENLKTVICPDKYRSIIFDKCTTVFDYINDSICVVVDSKRVSERARAYYWEISKQMESLTDRGLTDFDTARCCLTDNEFKLLTEKKSVVFDAFLNTGTTGKYKSYANISTKQNSVAGLNLSVLAEELETLTNAGHSVLYIASNSVSAANTLSVLEDKNIPAFRFEKELKDGYVAVSVPLKGVISGFELPAAGFSVIAEEAVAPKKVNRRNIDASFKGERITSYADLSIGDYVVHINHGIGVFCGLHNLVTDGVARDFIKISYAGGDTLYVPAGRLDTVSKYVGNTEKIKLNRLGGTEWFRTKQKAKNSAKNIAKELLQLYGERQRGIACPCVTDDELQEEFEAMFEYPETEGQLVAAKEIKTDMEKSVPMERLLCGDVGFGKTEVALRAAFKAVNSGKQVAVLVPTTILAWQHFQTMKTRFRGFPVNIGMLSSFNDKRTNDENVAKLKTGRLDVVVGTHRLLQKDVGFKDLGLLIIDEEQRFGVTHKERLKTLAKSVHTLTLSATPIPRTLNMALSGIRDMSVLEDAPTDRLPVQSYVLEYDEEILFNAIERELRRGGQVFYLHNNIDALYPAAAAISRRFPDCNVAVGHGQMDKDKLSEVWESMVKGETDILVCTTIIETGIDVPNANTLIIEEADRMGLSQLHQIRGRVGRSTRRAYAYFTYRRGKVLQEIAVKRLQAIKEYTEFGSGFKIAMRDLEIRGAGNLLGAEQHGHIESIGYDLYIKLLQEAVDEEKGIVSPQTVDCTVDIRVNAFIAEEYIASPAVRIDIYKKIAFASNESEKSDLCDELRDRFGPIPGEVISLIDISLARHKAAALGFTSIEQKEGLISMYSNKLDIRACTGLSTSSDFRGRIMISAGSRPHVSCRLKGGIGVLQTLTAMLDTYGKFCENV